jgi:hypothetical protein
MRAQIRREESDMVRYANAILPFASMDSLSAVEMLGLADMFEGWAQSGRTDSINMARLLGWADGFRSLAAEVRADYVPPEPPPDAAASLLKFMARKMFERLVGAWLARPSPRKPRRLTPGYSVSERIWISKVSCKSASRQPSRHRLIKGPGLARARHEAGSSRGPHGDRGADNNGLMIFAQMGVIRVINRH